MTEAKAQKLVRVDLGALLWKSFVLFALGAAVGPLGDICHVITGTDAYPGISFGIENWGMQYFIIPWWVPLIFGSATLIYGSAHPMIDRILKTNARRLGSSDIHHVIVSIFCFLAIYAASGFLPLETGGAKDFVLAASSIALWAWMDRTWQGVVGGLLFAIGGVATEMFLTRGAHAFYYLPEVANMNGVPSWLPWIYFAAATAVGAFESYLSRPRPRHARDFFLCLS